MLTSQHVHIPKSPSSSSCFTCGVVDCFDVGDISNETADFCDAFGFFDTVGMGSVSLTLCNITEEI